MNALEIYVGSDGEKTKALYAHLETLGLLGHVAVNLFRAQKCSERAKVYRGGGFRGAAYDRKNWSLQNLCKALEAATPFEWGWKEDPAQSFHCWVLYVELPTGQVSFHAAAPLCARRFDGEWDHSKDSPSRIVRFVQSLLVGGNDKLSREAGH